MSGSFCHLKNVQCSLCHGNLAAAPTKDGIVA